MEITLILVSIFTPLFFVGSLVYFIFIYAVNYTNTLLKDDQGTLIYLFDLKNRSYKISPSQFNKNALHSRHKLKTWKSINILYTNVFVKETDRKKFRALLQKLDKGSEIEKITVFKNMGKEKIVQFNFEFRQDKGTDYYICIEKWQVINSKESQNQSVFKTLLPENILIDNDKYKGFIAFNLIPFEEEAQKSIIDIIEGFSHRFTMRWMHKSGFILNDGLLIFYLETGNKNKMVNRIKKFTNEFNAVKITKLGNKFYKGSAIAYTKNVNSFKNLNKVYATLEFLINKSIEDQEDFVLHTEKLNKEEFNAFIFAFKNFKNALKSDNFEFDNKPVRYWTTNKKIASYVYIKIDSINTNMMKKIIRNITNRNLLMDHVAKNVGVDKKVHDPVLIDVRADWMLKNYKKLTYKQAIYVINFNNSFSHKLLQPIVEYLHSKNFVFAVKIRKYSKDITFLLKYLNTQFVVISHHLKNDNKNYDSQLLINLMSLHQVCKAKKIKMIYDNPPIYLDEITTKKIGLKFYYK